MVAPMLRWGFDVLPSLVCVACRGVSPLLGRLIVWRSCIALTRFVSTCVDALCCGVRMWKAPDQVGFWSGVFVLFALRFRVVGARQ